MKDFLAFPVRLFVPLVVAATAACGGGGDTADEPLAAGEEEISSVDALKLASETLAGDPADAHERTYFGIGTDGDGAACRVEIRESGTSSSLRYLIASIDGSNDSKDATAQIESTAPRITVRRTSETIIFNAKRVAPGSLRKTSNIDAVFSDRGAKGFDQIRILQVRAEERDYDTNLVRFEQSRCQDIKPILHLSDADGEALAARAQAEWIARNPGASRRPEDTYYASSCSLLSAQRLQCIFGTSGEEDHEDPSVTAKFVVKDGQVQEILEVTFEH